MVCKWPVPLTAWSAMLGPTGHYDATDGSEVCSTESSCVAAPALPFITSVPTNHRP